VYDVETAAKTMADLVEHPQREVFVGSSGRMITGMHAVAPGAAEQVFAKQVDKGHLSKDEQAPPTTGNLFEPMLEGADASGGWKDNK
jgi:hypothetical protein